MRETTRIASAITKNENKKCTMSIIKGFYQISRFLPVS